MFVVNNKNYFITNKESSNVFTRQRSNLYLPQANLTTYQKGACYLGIKIFNNLPMEVKEIDSPKKFKIVLKHFLYIHSSYTLEEYYNR
jgi:hypothetical protein